MCVFPKNLSEIAAAPQAAGMADHRHRLRSPCQHPAGRLQAVCVQVFHRRHVETFTEHPETFPLTQEGRSSQLRDGEFFREMLMNVDHHQLDLIVAFAVGSAVFQHRAGQFKKHQPYFRQGFPQLHFIAKFLTGKTKCFCDAFQNGFLRRISGKKRNQFDLRGCSNGGDIFFSIRLPGSPESRERSKIWRSWMFSSVCGMALVIWSTLEFTRPPLPAGNKSFPPGV